MHGQVAKRTIYKVALAPLLMDTSTRPADPYVIVLFAYVIVHLLDPSGNRVISVREFGL